MRRQADHQAIRQKLMEVTAEIIYTEGIEGVTSKKIANKSGIPEVNIYRNFIDLADLYKKTYTMVEEYFFKQLAVIIREYMESDRSEEAIKQASKRFWEAFRENTKYVVFFLRYYHSTGFDREMQLAHRERSFELLATVKAREDISPEDVSFIDEILLIVSEYLMMVDREEFIEEENVHEKIAKLILILMNNRKVRLYE